MRDKAVVIACMHVFCLACLSRWSALKRTCPLCKVTPATQYSFWALRPLSDLTPASHAFIFKYPNPYLDACLAAAAWF